MIEKNPEQPHGSVLYTPCTGPGLESHGTPPTPKTPLMFVIQPQKRTIGPSGGIQTFGSQVSRGPEWEEAHEGGGLKPTKNLTGSVHIARKIDFTQVL